MQNKTTKKKEESSTKKIEPLDYAVFFSGKEEKALEKALDVRKFEIELYWKRATYFWTFIGATFAGFLAIQISSTSTQNKEELSVLIACFGVVFSLAWFFVNKGSKFWQENWEKHVDVLEDKTIGPLYKITLTRNTEDFTLWQKFKNMIAGPGRYSVSKINQIVNLYVFILWIILLLHSLPLWDFIESKNPYKSINSFYSALIGITVVVCIIIFWRCKSYPHGHWHIAELRKSRLKPKMKKKQGIILKIIQWMMSKIKPDNKL